MSYDFIKEIQDNISINIPFSSEISRQVLKKIQDRSSNVNELVEIIRYDPPLTARILRKVNKTYNRALSKICSLERAVVALGFETLREIVSTMPVSNYFTMAEKHNDMDIIGLWLHSVGTAKASLIIAEKVGYEQLDVVYTVALLHDFGKFVLISSIPRNYSNVINYSKINNCQIIHSEHTFLNLDHTMIGKILCDIWELPEKIKEVMLYYHDPGEINGDTRKLAQIINLGNHMCRKAEIGNPGDDQIPELSEDTLELLGEEPDEINENYNLLFEKISNKKLHIEYFFDLLK